VSVVNHVGYTRQSKNSKQNYTWSFQTQRHAGGGELHALSIYQTQRKLGN